MQDMLAAEGFDPTLTRPGPEALLAIRQQRPDVVVLDLAYGDDFIARVRAAIEAKPKIPLPKQAPLPVSVLTWAADVMTRQARGSVTRWVQRLRLDEDFRDYGFDVADAINFVPFLIPTLAAAMRYGIEQADAEREQLLQAAREHVRTRQSKGVPLAIILRECYYLRDEIWAELERGLPQLRVSAEDIFQLGRRLNHTLDHMTCTIADAYRTPL